MNEELQLWYISYIEDGEVISIRYFYTPKDFSPTKEQVLTDLDIDRGGSIDEPSHCWFDYGKIPTDNLPVVKSHEN